MFLYFYFQFLITERASLTNVELSPWYSQWKDIGGLNQFSAAANQNKQQNNWQFPDMLGRSKTHYASSSSITYHREDYRYG